MLLTHGHASRSSSLLHALLLLLIVALGVCQAAFPTSTDSFIGELERCAPAAQSDVDCLSPLQVGLRRAQTFMQDVHEMRGRLQALSSTTSTAKSVLGLVSFVPAISAAAKVLDRTLSTLKPTVDRAYSVAASIDDKLWPYKQRVDNLLTVIDRAKRALTTAKLRCTDGATYTRRARDCITAMPNGVLRGELGSASEAFSSSIEAPIHSAVQAMSSSGSACSQLRSFASRSWPDLTPVKSSLDSVSHALDPIISGLQKVKDVLGQQVCLPISSPGEIAEEAAEALNPTNWFGKRRRNVRNINDLADAAAEFAAVSESRRDAHAVLKRNWCVSVQDVINGANGALDAFLRPAQDLLNRALSGLPSLQIPGLPDFTSLLSFDVSFSVPSLDLQLDFSLVDPLANLDFRCPINVSASCSAGVALSSASSSLCSRSVSQYAPTTTTTTTASPAQIIRDWLSHFSGVFGGLG